MTKGQKELKRRMEETRRLLTADEAFDIYAEFVMRSQASCKWNPYSHRYRDYELWELNAKASMWHKQTLGSLLLQNELKLTVFNGGIKCFY